MAGVLERHGRWFCSEACAETFARPADRGAVRRRIWTDPWVWVPASGLLIATAWMWAPPATAVSAIYLGYVKKIIGPLFLGLGIGGLIDRFVPKTHIVALLSGSRKRVIARSTVLGVLASACSHGCLALSMELYRKGASTAASLSFLLASPWANFSLTLLLIGLFGIKGLVLVAAAMLVAFMTGLVFQRLEARGIIPPNPHAHGVAAAPMEWREIARQVRGYRWSRRQVAQDVRGVWRGMLPLGRMVMGWVQIGLILSAVIGATVPHQLFTRWLGPTPLGLLTTLLAATALEVCSEGTAPVAFELYRHTGALGNAFVFLVAGVVTDVTELGAVWATMGRRTVGWLLAIALPLVLALGLVLNRWP